MRFSTVEVLAVDQDVVKKQISAMISNLAKLLGEES
jgi:hypothetical protein